MQINQKFVSKRLLLSLFFCASSVILLQNYNLSKNSSFSFDIICLVVGIALCALIFLPSIILKTKYNYDAVSSIKSYSPKLFYVLFAVYAAYFVYSAEYFLLRYTEMFREKYSSEAAEAIIAFIMLAVCFYAACQGSNVVTRFGIFVFIFGLLSYILLFSGSINSLDFFHYDFSFHGGADNFWSNVLFFATPSFIAVIFACLSGYTQNFRLRQPMITLMILALEFAAFMFFIYFALGDYADNQSYQTYIMSKVSQISELGGIESFYFALTTLCVFLAVSLMLCCINRGIDDKKPLMNTAIFAGVIFALHICAVCINPVKEVLTDPMIFVIFTVITAFLIPLIYLLVIRRHKNA